MRWDKCYANRIIKGKEIPSVAVLVFVFVSVVAVVAVVAAGQQRCSFVAPL